MKSLSFEVAASKVIPLGKFLGLTLRQVSQTPNGDIYLESLLTDRYVGMPLKQAIQVFLRTEDIPAGR